MPNNLCIANVDASDIEDERVIILILILIRKNVAFGDINSIYAHIIYIMLFYPQFLHK